MCDWRVFDTVTTPFFAFIVSRCLLFDKFLDFKKVRIRKNTHKIQKLVIKDYFGQIRPPGS